MEDVSFESSFVDSNKVCILVDLIFVVSCLLYKSHEFDVVIVDGVEFLLPDPIKLDYGIDGRVDFLECGGEGGFKICPTGKLGSFVCFVLGSAPVVGFPFRVVEDKQNFLCIRAIFIFEEDFTVFNKVCDLGFAIVLGWFRYGYVVCGLFKGFDQVVERYGRYCLWWCGCGE